MNEGRGCGTRRSQISNWEEAVPNVETRSRGPGRAARWLERGPRTARLPFNPQSGHRLEATNECINKGNDKSTFLSHQFTKFKKEHTLCSLRTCAIITCGALKPVAQGMGPSCLGTVWTLDP